jgi:hypothetical protein
MAIDFSDLGGVPVSSAPIDFADLGGQRIDQNSGTDYKRLASDYLMHPLIEGGAMTLGGAAGGIVGSGAGPVGTAVGGVAGAAAMYPPAHQFANAIDQYVGINRPTDYSGPIQNQLAQSGKDFGTGVGIEATGAALKPVVNGLGKVAGAILPGAKTGEALSGTPARNLTRAYKQGFYDTYVSPKNLKAAGSAYGDAESNLVGKTLTPEDQANILINPKGEANQKIADTYTQWLKGQPISPEDAVAARKAIDVVYPPSTARNMPRIAKFSEFRSALNDVIGQTAPDFKQASDDYAASKLRSQLLKPARVNTSNPDQYSKLGAMLEGVALTGGAGFGHAIPIAAGILGTSPLAMGLASSVAGSTARGISGLAGNPAISRSVAAFVQHYLETHPSAPGTLNQSGGGY